MKDQTQLRVVQAAGPIFADKGFDRATIREICTAAEANLASVNYHFGDKETLYLEAVRHAHALKMEQVPLSQWPSNTPPEEQLRFFIRAMLSRMLGTDELDWGTRLLMREMIEPTIACKSIVEDFIRPQLQLLLSILDEMVPQNISFHRKHQMAFSIVGQCLHYRVAREFVNLLIPEKERAEHFDRNHLVDHITEFSLAAIKNLPIPDSSEKKTS